ncbi:MAG TPA: hypothetical protein VM925_28340 [Labilithrix sp.]|jgi:hypothetical protein|nr:hypothetical protein [Labilithrix sp.]
MTNPIRERSRSDLHGADEPSGSTPTAARNNPSTAATRASRSAPDYDRVGDAPGYLEFLANVGRGQEMERPVRMSQAERAEAIATRRADVETRMRLDAFRASFSGPYSVDGKPVHARPMFRMNGGANDVKLRAHEPELHAICTRARVPAEAVGNAKVGRPTPEQLRQVTQALIDAGKLSPGTDDSLDLRIRQLQWEWGIGVDCAGYTEQAARAARGEKPKAPTHGDAFSGLSRDRTMRKVDVPDIRPGDVIHLDRPTPRDVGHNVIVYGHHVAGSEERTRLGTAMGVAAEPFLAGQGPFHVLEVDSSWGAGAHGGDYGGFRRDTWIYDEGSSRWGYLESSTKAFMTSERGPHSEPYTGAFRPKGAS